MPLADADGGDVALFSEVSSGFGSAAAALARSKAPPHSSPRLYSRALPTRSSESAPPRAHRRVALRTFKLSAAAGGRRGRRGREGRACDGRAERVRHRGRAVLRRRQRVVQHLPRRLSECGAAPQPAATPCTVLQHSTTCRNTVHRVATLYNMLRHSSRTLRQCCGCLDGYSEFGAAPTSVSGAARAAAAAHANGRATAAEHTGLSGAELQGGAAPRCAALCLCASVECGARCRVRFACAHRARPVDCGECA